MNKQNWSNYDKLSFYIYSSSDKVRPRVLLKDNEAEVYESIPIKPERGKWKRISLDFKDNFRRGRNVAGYGNKIFDKQGIREIIIEISSKGAINRSAVYIDEIELIAE